MRAMFPYVFRGSPIQMQSSKKSDTNPAETSGRFPQITHQSGPADSLRLHGGGGASPPASASTPGGGASTFV